MREFLRRVVWPAVVAVFVGFGAFVVALLSGDLTNMVLALIGIAVVLAILVPRNNEES